MRHWDWVRGQSAVRKSHTKLLARVSMCEKEVLHRLAQVEVGQRQGALATEGENKTRVQQILEGLKQTNGADATTQEKE